MQEYNSKIEQLIVRYLKEELEEKDKQILISWIEESSMNKKFFERISSNKRFQNKILQYKSIDVDKALIRNNALIKRKTNIRRIITSLPYAAAILALSLMIPNVVNKKELPVLNSASIIKSGSSKAQLFLANGKMLELGDCDTKHIKESHGGIIEVKDKMIEYKASDSNTKQIFNTIKTPRGGEYNLKLSDGTVVWINADSELKYPVNFIGKNRIVEITGEAYFKVKKDKDKPFLIKTSKGQIKVLGTSFNVRNYADENNFTTTLVEGSIELKTNKEKVILKPGKQAIVRGNDDIVVNDVDTDIYTSWKDGRFIFKRQRLEEIMNTLSRWYNVNVFFEDSSAKDVLFTGNLQRYSNFEKIIKMVEMMNKVKFRMKDNTIWVRKL